MSAPLAGSARPEHRGYAGAADYWAADATLAYDPLARHLVARSPLDLDGARALDVGAGTGAASRALRAGGACVVAVDLEPDMVRRAARDGLALVSEAGRLPFADHSFDLTVAAFLLNHLPDAAEGLRELRRVTRTDGAVLCSVFSTHRAEAKNAVDEVATNYGYAAPEWYRRLHEHALRIGTESALSDACAQAGFGKVEVSRQTLDLGLSDPALVVRYRLGMPQLRRFVDRLTPVRRKAFTADAIAAVRRTGERFAPEVIEVVARS